MTWKRCSPKMGSISGPQESSAGMKTQQPTPAQIAKWQAAVDLLWKDRILSAEQNNRLQNKLENMRNGLDRWRGSYQDLEEVK